MVTRKMEKKAKRIRIYSFLLALLLVAAGFFSIRIYTEVYAKAWDCVVTDHEDPAMQYLSTADEQEYAAQYIYIKVEGADYAIAEGDVMTEPNFSNKTSTIDAEKFIKMNGKAIKLNRFLLGACDGKFAKENYDDVLLNGTPLSTFNDAKTVPASQWIAAKWGAGDTFNGALIQSWNDGKPYTLQIREFCIVKAEDTRKFKGNETIGEIPACQGVDDALGRYVYKWNLTKANGATMDLSSSQQIQSLTAAAGGEGALYAKVALPHRKNGGAARL